jgi:hypothetical protein
MNSSRHDPSYFVASKNPVEIKQHHHLRPAVGNYDDLVHLLANNDNAASLVGSANYSTTMDQHDTSSTRNVEEKGHETLLQHHQDLSSFDFNPTPIQPQGVHVVDRVQLSPWLPPDGCTVDFLHRLLILGQQGGMVPPVAPSTESSAYRANMAAVTPRGSTAAPRKRPKKKHKTLLVPAADESSEAASSDSSYCSEYPHQRVGVLAPNPWADKFQDLIKFKDAHGHCHVPHNWASNYSLAQWVKRQRYQYKLKIDSQHSNLTSEREEALERLGFVWNPQGFTWEERLHELASYVTDTGHSSVPKNYPANPSLAVWVKCQRRQFKLFSKGVQSAMTKDRILKLKEIGFIFNPRSSLQHHMRECDYNKM